MQPFDRKLKILICDDDEGIRESFKLILEDHELAFVNSGAEAIEYARRNPIDAMIVDINMPRINGIEVLQRVRAFNTTLPIIIATGYDSVEIAQETVRLGASEYLVKPFSSQQVYTALHRALKIPIV